MSEMRGNRMKMEAVGEIERVKRRVLMPRRQETSARVKRTSLKKT